MAKTFDALKKAEAERARAAQVADPAIVRRRNGSRRGSFDPSHLGPSVEEQYQKLRGTCSPTARRRACAR
jgi:hypothetical protein